MTQLPGILGDGADPIGAATTSPPDGGATEENTNRRDSQRIVVGAVLAGGIVIFAIVVFAFQPGGPGVGALGTGIVVGGGAVAVGSFLGLLFGVPRLLEQSSGATGDPGVPRGGGYQANTNLTEISDWLTKIIVGISLIQLGTIRDQLLALVEALAPGFGSSHGAAPFVAGLLATSTVIGFLAGYLLARIYLPRVFNEADVIMRVTRESRRVVVEAVQQQTIDSSTADAAAIRLVDRALGSGANAQHPTLDELADAMAKASPGTRASLVSRASDIRAANWSTDKAMMELTIPVFQALIRANDSDHYLHGQLGFALKDKQQPDNEGAIAELTRAIELRGDPTVAGWLFYEWNRALARVRLEVARGGPSDKAMKDLILDDLRTAFQIPELRDLAKEQPDFTRWAEENNVRLATIKAG
jgi:hypothetical protein